MYMFGLLSKISMFPFMEFSFENRFICQLSRSDTGRRPFGTISSKKRVEAFLQKSPGIPKGIHSQSTVAR